DVHLDRLARASSLVRHPILLCGSAGLAGGLARATPSAAARTELPQGGRAVVVVGSTNAIATRQVQRLGCAPGWRVLEVPISASLGTDEAWRAWLDDARRLLIETDGDQGGVLVSVARNWAS